MLEQVRATIMKYKMIREGDRVLVGVSGGPDSVALLHVLKSLTKEMDFVIFVAHLDHGFRGQESAEDAIYVQELAESMNVQVLAERRDVAGYALEKKMSAQTAAREVRYCFFEEAAETFKCNKLATGHNANDQAETVIFNFLRGTGSAGLGGIPPVRDGWVIRPLVETTRTDIDAYCIQANLKTRLDKTNLKEVYTRNKIRLNLVPHLEREYNHNLVETLVRMSEIFREEEDFLETLVSQEKDKLFLHESHDKIELCLTSLKNLPRVLQKRVLRRVWQKLSGNAYTLEFVHLENILKAIQKSQTGSVIHLPGGVFLQKLYETLVFTLEYAVDEPVYSYFIKVPGITVIKETGVEIITEFVEASSMVKAGQGEIFIDYDAVTHPLRVRNREPGDWFKPLGMTGTQKVKKYFIDHKIPRDVRNKIPLIVSGDNQLVWVAGVREDGRWQVTKETGKILKIKMSGITC